MVERYGVRRHYAESGHSAVLCFDRMPLLAGLRPTQLLLRKHEQK